MLSEELFLWAETSVGAKVHLTSCHRCQHSDSTTLVFPINLCTSASGTVSKVHSSCVGQAPEREETGLCSI